MKEKPSQSGLAYSVCVCGLQSSSSGQPYLYTMYQGEAWSALYTSYRACAPSAGSLSASKDYQCIKFLSHEL